MTSPAGAAAAPGAAGRKDVHARVTEKIVADLERGVRPWLRPWRAGHAAGRATRPLRHDGTPYRGINVVMLWTAAAAQGYACPTWMTFRQAKALGGFVRKGESGTLVVHAGTFMAAEADDGGGETGREIRYLKGYTVFNCEQIEGLPARYRACDAAVPEPRARLVRAEAFFANTRADIRHGGDRAYYAIGPDYIRMPPAGAFRDAECHAATLAHELTHWTRHPSRLDRDLGRKRWGDEGYAREELVAEIGAAFLCADLGIAPEVREDHAAYVASWLKVLTDDRRAVFQAAAHAQRAVDYLHGLQPKAQDADAAQESAA